MALRASSRTAAGSLFPRRLHPAAGRRRDRFPEQGARLRAADARRRRGDDRLAAKRLAPRSACSPSCTLGDRRSRIIRMCIVSFPAAASRSMVSAGSPASPASSCPSSARPDLSPLVPLWIGSRLRERRVAFLRRTGAARRGRAFAARIRSLRNTDWVVYAKPPFGGPSRFSPISRATRIARPSPTPGSSRSPTTRSPSPTRTIAATAAAGSCASRRTSSFAAFFCTSSRRFSPHPSLRLLGQGRPQRKLELCRKLAAVDHPDDPQVPIGEQKSPRTSTRILYLRLQRLMRRIRAVRLSGRVPSGATRHEPRNRSRLFSRCASASRIAFPDAPRRSASPSPTVTSLAAGKQPRPVSQPELRSLFPPILTIDFHGALRSTLRAKPSRGALSP